jgi:hypothetical protein
MKTFATSLIVSAICVISSTDNAAKMQLLFVRRASNLMKRSFIARQRQRVTARNQFVSFFALKVCGIAAFFDQKGSWCFWQREIRSYFFVELQSFDNAISSCHELLKTCPVKERILVVKNGLMDFAPNWANYIQKSYYNYAGEQKKEMHF